MKFHHVACGGTFDHLHLGHKKLLNECLQSGEKVTVGILSGALARHKAYPFSIESYAVREKNVAQLNRAFFLCKLHDIYGPTLTDMTIDAICVTKDTLFGAQLINKKRKELGMRPLSIIIAPFVYDEKNEKISSEHIRQGIVSKEGKRYDTLLFGKEKYILPESLRGQLRKPLGRVISSFSSLSDKEIETIKKRACRQGYPPYCAVGDMVTLELKKKGILPFISIIDGFTKRKALNKEFFDFILEKDRYEALNEKSTIHRESCIKIGELFGAGHKKAIRQLLVHGEEDLLTLAAVLLAPLETTIWYGQQDMGIVEIRVTEKIKETVYNLVRQFE